MIRSRQLCSIAAIAILPLLLAVPARARVVSFPMHLDHAFIRQLLLADVFTGPDESTRVWQDENKCNDIVLSHPKVSGRDGKVHLVADFSAKLGAGIGSWCMNVTDWIGTLDATMEAQLHPSLPIITFRVVNSDIYGADGAKSFTGTLWDWVKSLVHPRLETIRIDLYQPLNELKTFLPMVFPGSNFDRVQRLLDSVALSEVAVTDADITVRVQLDVPEPAAVTPAMPIAEPTLTMDELERWDKAWQSWDGFLTFLIKHSSEGASDRLRHDLREVFLEARYDIAAILRPTSSRPSEPVRPLFLKTWKRLAPIMRQLTADLPGKTALRYMSFITAADALSALEQLGPDYGIEITANGLRRMARMIEPAPFGDPVSYSEAVDPELRKLFGFGPPPPTPLQEETLEEEEVVDDATPGEELTPAAVDEATPTEEIDDEEEAMPADETTDDELTPMTDETREEEETPTPAVTLPPVAIRPPPNPLLGKEGGPESPPWQAAGTHVFAPPYQGGPTGGFFDLARSWFTATAWAETPADSPKSSDRPLDRWIPTREEVAGYLPRVRDLLLAASRETQSEKKLDAQHSTLFRHMMLTTAWQESCWRQFIKKGKSLQPLTSSVGAVGIMQVNARVWRGFYDQQALRNSMKYNAEAGSEILHHYLVDYAIAKSEQAARNNPDDLARATYAAYNGGPGKLRRYRQQAGGKTGHRIDEAFWKKYQQIKAGNDYAVASCFGVTVTG